MNSECELIYIDKYYIICKLLKKLKIIIIIILIKNYVWKLECMYWLVFMGDFLEVN